MPSTPYDLVQDDQDLRVPLHAEQAFFHGITFQAKFVGWEEVPRPNTRAEIVQAMRRIRYECKVQNLKKRKVTIQISVNGVRVVLKKRRRKKKNWTNDPEEIELLNHPIYRIFYVSHDSSDLKIFSYIARDASTDTFKCSVFKSHKKSQAMRIVRTVGQAFEVCHKFNLHKNSLDHNDERSDVSSEILDVERLSEQQLTDDEQAKKEQLTVATETKPPQRPNHLELVPHSSLNMRKSPSLQPAEEDKSPTTPSSPSHEIIKLKDQLEQQAIQTRQALAQLMLVREQLISETNARIEAQARTQQLLQQNRELLEHLASLGAYNEQQTAGLTSANIGMAPQLQMLLHATNNNNNLATINQQINSLGSINQQLTSLSHQLSGLNQQSQNLQQFQNINAVSLQSTSTQQQQQQQKSQLTPPTPAASMHLSVTPTNVTNSNNNINNNSGGTSTNTSPFPSMNQLQSISNQLQQINTQSTQHQQDLLSKDLFQVNQELLNRLQALNLNASTSNALSVNNTSGIGVGVGGGAGAGMTAQQTPSPHNSFFFVNPMSCSPSNNNNNANNFNFLNSPNTLTGNLTPSPMGTLTRNSYTHSPQPQQDNEVLRINSIDKNLNCLIDEQLMKPGTSNGNLASISTSCSSSTVDSPSSPRIRNTNNEPRFNTVMLRVTDESGNVTNQRKLSATPSFIQRSTSEKVPNRSQMMSQVQRTAWARHTTK